MYPPRISAAPQHAISLVMAAVAWNLAGCGGGCLDLSTAYGALLHLDTEAAVGTYRAEADVGGETLLVAFTRSADGRSTCAARCEDTQGMFQLSSVFGWSDVPEDVTLHLRHTDERSGPARFQLRIYRDDVLVTDEEIRPSYRTTEPRGEGCGESTSAQIDVVVR